MSSMLCQVVVSLSIDTNARKVTGYLSEKYVVKATRRHRYNKRDHQETYLVTIGRPNYAERKFIKLCKEVNEPFPIKKLQYQLWPKARG